MQFKSHSEAGQDVFVYKLLIEGNVLNASGTFLDIGCAEPIMNNNTYSLERYCGWQGILIDYVDFSADVQSLRTSKFVHADVTHDSWFQKVKNAGLDTSKPIDYLSFDLDTAGVTVIEAFPFHEMQFRTITIEHDKYRFGQEAQDRIHAVLCRNGYERICSNVEARAGFPFEDWYVHPDLVDMERANCFRCDGLVWHDVFAKMSKQTFV